MESINPARRQSGQTMRYIRGVGVITASENDDGMDYRETKGKCQGDWRSGALSVILKKESEEKKYGENRKDFFQECGVSAL